MLISHKHKIINISVPKTGSTSLHNVLKSELKLNFATKSGNAQLYHLNASDISLIIGARRFDSYFSFAVVRNPYDRMVSLYHDFHDKRGIIKSDSFDEFVIREFGKKIRNNLHFLPQCFFVCNNEGPIVKSLFRFERGLDEALNKVGHEVGLSFKKAPHARKSERRSWQEYYNDSSVVRIVEDTYREDFNTFGYDLIGS